MPDADLARPGPDLVRLIDAIEATLDGLRHAVRNGELDDALSATSLLQRDVNRLVQAEQWQADYACGCRYRQVTGDSYCLDHTHQGRPTADNPASERRHLNTIDERNP